MTWVLEFFLQVDFIPRICLLLYLEHYTTNITLTNDRLKLSTLFEITNRSRIDN